MTSIPAPGDGLPVLVTELENRYFASIPKPWRYRWCEASACACAGCCNRSPAARVIHLTKKQWEEWVKQNPENEGSR